MLSIAFLSPMAHRIHQKMTKSLGISKLELSFLQYKKTAWHNEVKFIGKDCLQIYKTLQLFTSSLSGLPDLLIGLVGHGVSAGAFEHLTVDGHLVNL